MVGQGTAALLTTLFFFFYFKDIGRRPVSDFKRMRLPIYLWVVRYFGILLVYNLVILLEVYLSVVILKMC
jgi:hypothetical protein